MAALLIAWLRRRPGRNASQTLALLLLPVGVEMLWAGLTHVLFPETAARFIGWQVSPFQFEVGVGEIAMGITAVASFWCGLAFKAAAICYAVLFYAGVAIGHVHQAVSADNLAPGNFGALLLETVIKVVVLPVLLWLATREQDSAATARASEGTHGHLVHP